MHELLLFFSGGLVYRATIIDAIQKGKKGMHLPDCHTRIVHVRINWKKIELRSLKWRDKDIMSQGILFPLHRVGIISVACRCHSSHVKATSQGPLLG